MKRLFTSLIFFIALISASVTKAQNFSDSTRIKQIAQLAVQKVDDNNRWIESLSPDDLNELPIGLKKTISNVTYKLAVSSAIFHDSYAELTVYAKVETPQKRLFFGISGLKLSYQGGIVGDAKLVLLGDEVININGGNAQLILKGGFNIGNGQGVNDLTYITMDCNGFKEMGLTADVVFPRNLLIPCTNNGDKIADENQKVKGGFQTKVSDWNDIIVSISLPKFQVNKLEGVVFTVTNAVFDFSDTRNKPNIIFPTGYEYRYLNLPNANLWRGVYIQTLDIMLPKAFERKSNERVSFGANNLIIDNNGLSGTLYGKNILSYNEGNASGWKFSVDEFSIGLEANKLIAAGFKGNIGLPVADKDSLRYEAVITEDNKYWLTVAPKGIMDFQLWQAKVKLDSNSYVKLLVDNDRFKPEANLYGTVSIEAKNKATSAKTIAKFDGITFRGMRLRTEDPYFAVDYFGYNGEVKLANFPVSIDSIVLVTNKNHANLSFGLKLTLQENGFKADTRLTIGAGFENKNGYHHWTFDGARVESIQINNAKIGALTLNGRADFMQDDPIYGDGFGGGIKATFNALGNAEVQVRCIFGYSDFRYWFVDGKAAFGNGIPIAGVLNLYGFAGGAYYRMSKIGYGGTTDQLMPNYKPDKVLGLGIKAGVLFNVVNKSTVDGMAEFEVAFNRNGGMAYIGFFGNAKFMGQLPGMTGDVLHSTAKIFEKIGSDDAALLAGLTDAEKQKKIEEEQTGKLQDPKNAGRTALDVPDGISNGISAYLGMMYDFNNSTFHASFDTYINAAQGLLQGVGNNYRAGWAVMHFAPDDWYVHMGTPTDPIGLRFGLGSFSLKTEAYFMMGSKIPGSPAPPREVADILGVDLKQLDYMRDLNALGDGRGFAFGSKVSIETGDITFLILYANFKAGVGFDLMLKQYANAHCEGSTAPIGINGWYANAQAYAYLQGELGVKVKLWFIKAKFPIIKGSAATLLQAKLPNPSWFQGYLGVRFSVLGGLVSGNVRFKLTLGNECKIVTDGADETPLGIAVISDLSPKETEKVDVFAAPQLALNFPVEKNIDIQDDQGQKTYKVVLDQYELKENGKTIPGKIVWNAGKDVATFYSTEILPSAAQVEVIAKVSFKELKGGSWQTCYIDGKKVEETRTLNFTTGQAPENIPLTNIEYAWPVVDQRNFYRNESGQGIIQLKRGQKYLFAVEGFKQSMQIQPKSGGVPTDLVYTYDADKQQLRFTIDKADGDQTHQLTLISKPSDGNGSLDAITKTSETKTDNGDNVTVQSNAAQNVKRTDVGKVLLTYSFHSSKYGTFKEKMQAVNIGASTWSKLASDVITLQQSVNGLEPFEVAELTGTSFTANKPLVVSSAVTDDSYFREAIEPLNYKNYPINGTIKLTNRDTTILGFVPVRAMPVINAYQSLIEQGNYTSSQVTSQLPYCYDLPRIYKADFIDLQNQVVNRYLGTTQQSQYAWLINGYFPFIRNGYYKVNYQYTLPNGVKGTSYTVNYYNPIK